jgi:predicted nucleotidyltransferase component of viral defense system
VRPREVRDRAASVRQRLLDRARAAGEDFNLTLTRYAGARLLYRLSVSPHRERFLLKGATLFALWDDSSHRVTRDLDLLGFGDPAVASMEAVFSELCAIEADDGLEFRAESVQGQEIRGGQEYDGVRVRLEARLGQARIRLQVDVGFGDAVVPPPEMIEVVALEGLPSARLRAYPREAVIAEKLHALVVLGIANTRMKDLYDLWSLAQRFEFDAGRLADSIAATFERRRTDVPNELPVGLSPAFAGDAEKIAQWRAFVRRTGATSAPELADAIARLRAFLMPAMGRARTRDGNAERWSAGGSWSTNGR